MCLCLWKPPPLAGSDDQFARQGGQRPHELIHGNVGRGALDLGDSRLRRFQSRAELLLRKAAGLSLLPNCCRQLDAQLSSWRSSALISRKSAASPTFRPAASSDLRFVESIVLAFVRHSFLLGRANRSVVPLEAVLAALITSSGILRDFLEYTSKTSTASGSPRYMIRQLCPASRTRRARSGRRVGQRFGLRHA